MNLPIWMLLLGCTVAFLLAGPVLMALRWPKLPPRTDDWQPAVRWDGELPQESKRTNDLDYHENNPVSDASSRE